MTPAQDTATAVIKDPSAIATFLKVSTSSPMYLAGSSPTAIRFKALTMHRDANVPTAMYGRATTTESHPLDDKLPMSHMAILGMSCPAITIMNETIADMNDPMTTPERRKVSTEIVPRSEAMRYTNTIVITAPIKAKSGIEGVTTLNVPTCNNIPTAAPREAPEDTPIMYGSASGFLKSP